MSNTQPVPVVLAEEHHKGWIDWTSQAFWLGMMLVVAPMLAAHEFPVHAIAVVVVSLASLVWIEYLARHGQTKGAWAIFAVIMVVLGIRRATRD